MTALPYVSAYGPYMLHVLGLSLCVVLVCCLVLGLAWTLHTYNVHQKYRHLPGPKVAHFFSGHARIFQTHIAAGRPVGTLILQWCQEYGPVHVIFIFAQEMVSVCSPEGVKELLVQAKHPKDKKSTGKIQWLLGERFMGTGLVTEIDHSTWAVRRAFVDPAFHRKHLKQSMTQFNSSSDLLIQRLQSKADGATQVTLLDELNKVTLDVIAKVSFSRELDIMVDDKSPFTEAVQTALEGLGQVLQGPVLEYSPLKAHRVQRKQIRDSCKLLRSFGERCVRERLAAIQRGEEVPADTLTYIINVTGQLTHDDYRIVNLVDDFVTFFVAGSETTANLLTSCMLELLHNQPDVLYRMKNEVESVIGDNSDVAFEDLPKLGYMTAVLKESLRLFPPAVGTARETAEECCINGHRIPAGASAMVWIYAMGRMEEYHKNATTFDPDRFMQQDEHILFTYLPFSLGPRMCLGKNFAMIEAKVLLCKLLTNFDFSLVPDQSFDMAPLGTLHPKDGCKVTVTSKQ